MVSDAAMQAQKTSFVKHFPWPFWTFPPGPGQSKQQHPPPPRYLSLDIYLYLYIFTAGIFRG